MKPYYQDSAVTIYHGDCREILPALPQVNLVLTDLPYGLNFPYFSYKDTKQGLYELLHSAVPMAISAGDTCAISCGIENMQLYPVAKWIVACMWDTTGSYGRVGFNQWFPLLIYGKVQPYTKSGFSDVISVTGGGSVGFQRDRLESCHVCPKPLNLISKAIARLSRDCDTVLDPFMGSGTTLRAAKDLERKAIGIEIEERYCEIAASRMAQEILPLHLVA